MNDLEREELLERAKIFFKEQIVEPHINEALARASQLESYNIQPFLLKYLANFLEGDASPNSMAKALVYPRILGTSITTIFGTAIQRMVSELFEGLGSVVPGIDIEFVDATDNRKKYCQLKSGPNTINKDDIKTVVNHFQGIKNLARVNNMDIRLTDLVVGIIYGEEDDLNAHYQKIKIDHPIYIGADFWHRLTGQNDFYMQLINAIGEVAIEVDGRERLEAAIAVLAEEIRIAFP